MTREKAGPVILVHNYSTTAEADKRIEVISQANFFSYFVFFPLRA